jgi:hypothetical protein
MAVLTTAQVAEKLGTDARTLRKFLRSDACKVESVGKGSRYQIEAKQVQQLRSQFTKWGAAQDEKPKTVTTKTETAPAEVSTHEVKEATGGQPTS